MSALSAILDGYVMVSIVYATSNLILYHTMRERMRIAWWGVALLTPVEVLAVYQGLYVHALGNIAVLFLFFLIFQRCADVEAYKHMYVLMVTVAYTTTCNLGLYILLGHFYDWTMKQTGLMLLLYAALLPVVLWWTRRFLWRRLSQMNLPSARWLWVLPAFVIIVSMTVGSAHVQSLMARQKLVFDVIAILTTLSLTAVALLVLDWLDKNQKMAAHQNNLHIMDMQLAAQSRHFSEMLKHIDEIRMMRHDMRHYVRTASMLLNNRKLEQLREYLNEMEACNQLQDNIVYSSNYISDLVAHHTLYAAREVDVSIVVQCGLPRYFWVSDADLSILLGNLMENALNACRMQPKGPRHIKIATAVRGDEAIIRVENSCCEAALDTVERRRAAGLHRSGGYGISSIHAVASKYNGTAIFSRQERRFAVSVLLYKPKADATKPAAKPRVENEMASAV